MIDSRAQTISIPLTCEFTTWNKIVPLDCTFEIENGKILVFPKGEISIKDAYMLAPGEEEEPIPNSKTFNLVANMELIDTDNADFDIFINEELEYAYLKPCAQQEDVEGFANFISVIEEHNTRLVTEETSKDSEEKVEQEPEEEKPDTSNIEAKVINEALDAVLPFTEERARALEKLMTNPITKERAKRELTEIFLDDTLLDMIPKVEADDIRDIIKERLAEILKDYDRDTSDFKIELEDSARKILNSIINSETLTEDTADHEEEPAWKIQYDLKENMLTEDEDSENTDNETSAIIHAPDLETAAKYAAQNIRIKARKDPAWKDAEVIAIEKHEEII